MFVCVFFKQKTAYEMRISDWSSYVCSSDLVAALCRALGGSDSDYRQLLLALRPVRPSLSDATIVGEAMRYQELSVAQADAAVGALRAPAALRAKLDHLRRIAG